MAKTNALLGYVDHVSRAGTVLSTNSEVDGLGVGNLATLSPQEVWRSATGATRWVRSDFGAPVEVGVVCLALPRSGVQLRSGDTVTAAFDNDTPGAGALGVAVMIDADYGYWWLAPETPIVARYLQISIVSSLPYVQAGRLWVGPACRPDWNFDYDWSREWADDGKTTRAPKSGRRFRDPGPRYRKVTVAFNAASSADSDAFEEGDRVVGAIGQMLLCTSPDTPRRRVLLGTPTEVSAITQPSFPIFSKPYTIEEDL